MKFWTSTQWPAFQISTNDTTGICKKKLSCNGQQNFPLMLRGLAKDLEWITQLYIKAVTSFFAVSDVLKASMSNALQAFHSNLSILQL